MRNKQQELSQQTKNYLESEKHKDALGVVAKSLIRNLVSKMSSVDENDNDAIREQLYDGLSGTITSEFDIGPFPFKVHVEFNDEEIASALENETFFESFEKLTREAEKK